MIPKHNDPTRLGTLVRPAMIARIVPAHGRIVVPDVRCDLTCMRGRLLLSGPLTHARASLPTGEPLMMASFDPVVIRRWLNIPLHLLTDRVIPLADLAPKLEGPLVVQFLSGTVEAIGLATSPIPASETDIRLASAAAELGRGGSVQAAAERAGVSERQLERLFETQLGIRPKLFSRILRLRRAIALSGKGAALADAAITAGYADQSHFNRDVQSFMAGAPSAILPHVGNVQDILYGNVAYTANRPAVSPASLWAPLTP
jgi:AraC-like DNA-binding protein